MCKEVVRRQGGGRPRFSPAGNDASPNSSEGKKSKYTAFVEQNRPTKKENDELDQSEAFQASKG